MWLLAVFIISNRVFTEGTPHGPSCPTLRNTAATVSAYSPPALPVAPPCVLPPSTSSSRTRTRGSLFPNRPTYDPRVRWVRANGIHIPYPIAMIGTQCREVPCADDLRAANATTLRVRRPQCVYSPWLPPGTCKLLNIVISDLVDEDFVLWRRQQNVSHWVLACLIQTCHIPAYICRHMCLPICLSPDGSMCGSSVRYARRDLAHRYQPACMHICMHALSAFHTHICTHMYDCCLWSTLPLHANLPPATGPSVPSPAT